MGRSTRVFVEEPAMVKNQGERWWNKVEQRHERAGIGNLVRPEDMYLSPWDLEDGCALFTGCDLDQLGAVDVLDADRSELSEVDFATRPTLRFHGIDSGADRSAEVADDAGCAGAAGGAEPGRGGAAGGAAAGVRVPYRLGSRTQQAGSATVYSESSYLAGDLRTPVIVRTAIASGRAGADLRSGDGAADRDLRGAGSERRRGCDGAAGAAQEVEDGGVSSRTSATLRWAITWCMWSMGSRSTAGCG